MNLITDDTPVLVWDDLNTLLSDDSWDASAVTTDFILDDLKESIRDDDLAEMTMDVLPTEYNFEWVDPLPHWEFWVSMVS